MMIRCFDRSLAVALARDERRSSVADVHSGSHRASSTKETVMAKGQQKSNREIKKPKKEKPAGASASSSLKGQLEPIPPPKKKG